METKIKKPSAGPQIASMVLGVVGSVLSLPVAALLGFALGLYPSRMECTTGTYGSGCYEGDLLNATILFALVYLPFLLPTVAITQLQRSKGRRTTDFIPLIVLCVVPAAVIVLCAVLALISPGSL
ncbi:MULTISPECIES: hypothetical protein [unclassified Arthrobacter]|uniref:hypothetical protein n=1 Tax=unclassified Arthrobacter TaxID=235627 RepID=UPI0011B013BC|nr:MULTISPECIES: hypothetical protein [unclassified Arthrobacter]